MLTILGMAMAVTFIATMSTTVYLHRSLTHGALELHPLAREGFKFCIWLTTGIRPWQWVAVHRKHHRHTDETGDPHSPYLEGFWPIQLLNIKYYLRAARHLETVQSFAQDVLKARTWIDRHVYNQGIYGLALGIVILCTALGFYPGLIAATIHTILYVFVLSPSVNGLCHHPHPYLGGYQRYKDPHARSTYNNLFLALCTCGEGYHHNHHWRQALARLGHLWWELDFGWYAILILEMFGLATSVRRPNPAERS